MYFVGDVNGTAFIVGLKDSAIILSVNILG